jgi:excisionase family DNA binding protein
MKLEEEILKKLNNIENILQIDNLLKRDLLTVEEAASVCGISKSSVYKWIATRRLNYFKPSGKLVYLRREDLYDFITRNKYSNKEELVSDAQAQMSKNQKLNALNGKNY